MKPAKVRAFRHRDAAAVRAVVEDVLREFGHLRSHRPGMGDLDDIAGAYMRFLVVESRGAIIGCGGLRRLRGREAKLQRMYLRPSARGRGLGREILSRLLAFARGEGIERVWLESSLRYQDAIALYLRNGFEGGLLDDSGCCGVILFKDL